MQRGMLVTLLLFTTVFISGCALCPQIDSQQKLIMQFDDYMIPLAKAVDVIADQLPQDATDQEIFSEAIRRSGNPGLLSPFNGNVLKARIQNGVGVILLCTPDGREAIIEDVTCTTRPDAWRPPGSPCIYLLDAERVCSSK